MRAVAFDQEAALAQGITVGRVFAIAWGAGAALAAIAGVLRSMSATDRHGSVRPASPALAFRALPAVILGGLDSVQGALVGGLAIGLAEIFAGSTSSELHRHARHRLPADRAVHRDARRAARPPVRPVRHAGDPEGLTCTADPTSTRATRPRLRSSRRGRRRVARSACSRRARAAAVHAAGHQPAPVRPVPGRQRLDRGSLTQAVIFAIAALGLNLLTGVAGQVSLGHAFFMGVGAYTAVVPRRRGQRPGCGAGPADLDLAPGRRHLRRAGRHHRVARPRCGSAGSTSASSPSAWCSSASTSSTGAAARSSGEPEVGRNFPTLEIRLVEGGEAARRLRQRRPLVVVRHRAAAPKKYLFVLALLARGRAGRQEHRPHAAPAGRCRRSATATSPPR